MPFVADSHESCCWPQLILRGKEQEALQLSSQNPSHCSELRFPKARSSLCSGDPNAREIRLYSRIKLEPKLCAPATYSKLLEAQQGSSCWARRIAIPSVAVATHRNDVGWGSSYLEWKNRTLFSFYESRMSCQHVPCA